MPKRTRQSYVRAGKLGAKASWSGVRALPIEERFWIKVKVGKPEQCWPWKGGRGWYGMFRFHNRRLTASHRVAYELQYGPIPEGQCVCHKCDFMRCCNPSHLFLGTQKENLQDGYKKGRMPIGETHGNAKLTEAKVRTIWKLSKRGIAQSKIAKKYGVTQTVISDVVRGVSWKHVYPSSVGK